MDSTQIRITDGKRSWTCSSLAVDVPSGTMTLDGKHTVMIYDWSKVKIAMEKPLVITDKTDTETAAKIGALKI